MIKEIKERRVSTSISKGQIFPLTFDAIIRDGKVTSLDAIVSFPNVNQIQSYITFLQEVLEAINQTQ